jgi:hypothetical protein
MRVGYPWRLGVAVLTPLLSGLLAPTASAAVPLGGGAGIVVGGSYCTLATIGHDNTGVLVGFTAAHCGGPGSRVVAKGTSDPVGSVVAANDDLDYAVIKFDPAAVTPTASFAGFPINGLGPDPAYRQPACKVGAATGAFCGAISSLAGPGPHMSMSRSGPFQPGDDGGPVTSDDLLVAIVRGGKVLTPLELPPFPVTDLVKFSAILADVNANGGPGAGFAPMPN